MKKIILFSFAVTAISIASCRKTRTCTCTGTKTTVSTFTNSSGAVVTTSTTSEPNDYTDVVTDIKSSEISGRRDCMSRTKTFTNVSVNGGITQTDNITEDSNCTIK